MQLLSENAFTDIYHLNHPEDMNSRVLKVVKPEANFAFWENRLNHEYQISQNLSTHLKNTVCPALEKTTWQGRPALVLSYIPGISLKAHFNQSETEDPNLSAALKIALNVSEALAELHHQEYLHLSVCPEHILIHPRSQEVTLISLGQAQALHDPNKSLSPTPKECLDFRYMAPEQMGRMGRNVSQHSDLYSLGVVLYELFTGYLPFVTEDHLELIYAHQTLTPPDPRQFFPHETEGMATLAEMILKLLAKDPKERYQSAESLVHDLKLCWHTYQHEHRLPELEPALWDCQGHFELSADIFGREQEIQHLETAVAGLSEQKQAKILLLTGPSGSGKSRLIQETLKQYKCRDSTEEINTCIMQGGKYEAQGEPLPYQALSRSILDWLRQILLAEAELLEKWKTYFKDAFQTPPLALLTLIPQLELFFDVTDDKNRSLTETPQARKAQLKLAVIALFRLLIRHQGPLLIAIDDLNRADTASLEWLSWLLKEPSLNEVLILATARSEDREAHALNQWIHTGQKTHCAIEKIEVPPLTAKAIEHWLKISLNAEVVNAHRLAKEVQALSQGNAFETQQILQQLYANGGLTFDREKHHWVWDLKPLQNRHQQDNDDLMQDLLEALQADARHLLHWAAICGRALNIEEWAQYAELKIETVRHYAQYFQEMGWLIAQENDYHFQHDRIQQSVLYYLTEDQLKQMHLRLGLRLREQHRLENTAPNETQMPHLYEMLYHLNHVTDLIQDEPLRLKLARYNWVAAQTARQNTSFEVSLKFARHGIQFLPEDAWEKQHELCFGLYLRQAEAQTMLSQLEVANQDFALLWEKARSVEEKLLLSNLQMNYYSQKNQHDIGLQIFQERMAEAGLPVPQQAIKFWGQIGAGLWWLRRCIPQQSLAELKKSAPIKDPQTLLQAQLMADVIELLQVMGNIPMILWIQVQMALICFKSGFFPMSPVNLVLLSNLFLLQFKDQSSAEKLLELAKYLNKTHPDPLIEAKFNTASALFTDPYLIPLNQVAQKLATAGTLFQHQGETILSFYNLYFGACLRLNQGQDLGYAEKELLASIRLMSEHHNDRGSKLLTDLQLTPLRVLRGKENLEKFLIQTEEFKVKYAHINPTTKELGTRFLMMAYLFQHQQAMASWSNYLQNTLKRPMIFLELSDGFFFLTLTFLELSYRGIQAEASKKSARRHMRFFRNLAQRYPINLQSRWLFLEAEALALEGQKLEAIQAYEEVLSKAEAEHNLLLTGLAAQRAGIWGQRAGLKPMAKHYLQQAQRNYAYWGAEGLCSALEADYPDLLYKRPSEPFQSSVNTLDYQGLTQAAVWIAEATDKQTLIKKLLCLTAQTAGADRSVLLLKYEGKWSIEAEFQASEERFQLARYAFDTAHRVAFQLPGDMLEASIKTQQARIIRDTYSELPDWVHLFEGEQAARSLLSLPLLRQGQIIGLLYLENRQIAGAFSSEHLNGLTVLATQAAIALFNAHLNQQLQARNQSLEIAVQKRTEALEQTNQELERVNTELEHQNKFLAQINRVKNEFLNMVSHDLKNPLNSILLFSRFLESRSLSEAKTREIGSMIARAGQRMFGLLEDLLDLNRLEQKQLKLNPEPLNWSIEIKSLLNEFESQAAEKHQRLHFLNQAKQDLIQADPNRLKQIMENLISNAIKFSEAESQISIMLENKQQSEGERVILSVLDQGPGLSPEELKLLFQPFVKLSPQPTGGESSSGLGLSIAYQLAEAMHGSLRCESHAGGAGCTFILSLPALKVPEGA